MQLVQGTFSKKDAWHILHQLVQTKIKFHEEQIGHNANEEDVKMRETRIKALQHDIQAIKQQIDHLQTEHITIDCAIQLNLHQHAS